MFDGRVKKMANRTEAHRCDHKEQKCLKSEKFAMERFIIFARRVQHHGKSSRENATAKAQDAQERS
ncbi:hypothetical protein EWH08_11585 [Sphingobium indicum]|uniref:Uncharacterized protein n=1 Tax=Sphingobium indicum TaxID=332055 RepID=A0A4Q4J7C5_9SPHN|nr:hypothetical protein EWH08_11585 [Sphingobium indicum]